jgi:hypothetical protein
MKNVYVFLDQRKQTIMQWVQDPSQSNADNLNNVTHEARRKFRNKQKAYLKAKIENLKLTVRSKILWACIGASKNLRRNVIYGYILSNTTISVFQLVFILSYIFQPVYNGHIHQPLARGGVLHIQ